MLPLIKLNDTIVSADMIVLVTRNGFFTEVTYQTVRCSGQEIRYEHEQVRDQQGYLFRQLTDLATVGKFTP